MTEEQGRPKVSLTRGILDYPWGEAALWMGFVFAMAGSSDNDSYISAAGVFALAAIGVRATRQPKGRSVD